MKEKIKNLSNKKIVITSLCAFAIFLLLGLTYAIWNRTFIQTGENVSTYDCFDITFSENTDGITMENGYPISDEEGLQSESYEVTVTNTCNTVSTYNVVLNKLNTSTLDDSYIKIAVNNDIRLLSETETTAPTIANVSEARIIKTGILAGNTSSTISIRSWMDEDTSLEEGSNKIFKNKITIEAVAGSKQLTSLILANNQLHTQKPDLKTFPVSKQTYNKLNSKYQKKYNMENELYMDEDDGGITYYFRGSVENNYVKFGNLKFHEDKYFYQMYYDGDLESCLEDLEYYDNKYGGNRAQTCNKKLGNDNNDMLWRIVRINGDSTVRLVLDNEIGATNWNDSIDSEEKNGYTHKEKTGKYKDIKLDNISKQGLSLSEIYYADSYTFDESTGQYSLVNPILRTKQECLDNNNLCLNKYTLNSKTLTSRNVVYKVNSMDNNFYYKDTHMAKPIFNEKEINSTIKEKVDTWYKTNLKDYDKYISTSTFCNDTRAQYNADFNVYYNYYLKGSDELSFKCSDTNAEYGGKYNLKVGLLSNDEIRFAGMGSGVYLNLDMYLANIPNFWSMTPYSYTGNSMFYVVELGSISSTFVNQHKVRPVINLKSEVKVTNGDGTKERPYVIE